MWLTVCCWALGAGSAVQGHVADLDGKPVSGARVFLEPGVTGALLEAEARADGGFRFEDVAPGTVGVFAAADGYAFGGATVNVAFGEQAAAVEIKLRPPDVVRGKVTDLRGKPVAGAEISPVVRAPEGTVGIPLAKLKPFGFGPALSDSAGAFVVPGLPKGGTVLLKVSHPLYAQEGLTDVAVGANDVQVQLQGGIVVQGAVVSREGAVPVAGADIVIQNTRPPRDSILTRTGHQGEFSVRLKPGAYLYQALARGAADGGLRSPGWEQLLVGDGAQTQRVTLRVAGLGGVHGKVCDASSGAPIPSAELEVSASGNPAARAHTGPSGEFEVPTAEGENTIVLRSTPGYVPPERNVLRVVVAAGQTLEVPTFWCTPIPAYSLEVVDGDNRPVSGAIVTVLRPAQFGWRVTDGEGRVALQVESVPADGRVIGMAEHRSEPFGALFALKREAGASPARVQLLPLGVVRGKVVTAKGRPIEGAVVGAVFAEDSLQPPLPFWRTLTTRNGEFKWESVVPYAPLRCVAVAGTVATPVGPSSSSDLPPGGRTYPRAGAADHAGAIADANEWASSDSFRVEPNAVKNVDNLVITQGQKRPSVQGQTLDWENLPSITSVGATGDAPSARAAVVLYCRAEEAQASVEAFASAQQLVNDDSVVFALVVDGDAVLQAGTPGIPVLRGKAPAPATTYVVDCEGRVVLETFGMPPLRIVQQVAAGARARQRSGSS